MEAITYDNLAAQQGDRLLEILVSIKDKRERYKLLKFLTRISMQYSSQVKNQRGVRPRTLRSR